MPEIGIAGQARLASARVLVVGAGGLGTPALLYLAGAGVGVIGVVDDDVVDASNLHRQVIHNTAAVGAKKTASAASRLTDLNPGVEVRRHDLRLSANNAREIVRGYDLVIDGSDNFPTRYLVNDSCVLEGKPLVFGALSRFDGQVSVLVGDRLPRLEDPTRDDAPAASEGPFAKKPARPPCYRCLFPQPPPPGTVPSCAEAGVLGPLPGVIGSLLASEALKLILGLGRPLSGRLLLVDLLEAESTQIAVDRDEDCPVCGDTPSITELIDYEAFCGLPASSPAG